jgi:ribonuclease HI
LLKFARKSPALEIYTDGSSKDGLGSWAYVICLNGKCIIENSGRSRRVNSNVMEFQAAIEALSDVPENSEITLFSDSRILIDTMRSGEGPRAFQTQIEMLIRLNRKYNIQWHWVKAHAGNRVKPGTSRCLWW